MLNKIVDAVSFFRAALVAARSREDAKRFVAAQ